MKDELKKILTNNPEGNLSQEQLLQYLKDELAQQEKHDFEKQLIDDSFSNDAVEGLQELKNQQKINLIVEGLNRDLRKKITNKRNLRNQRTIKTQWLLYFSIIIFLILIVLVFLYLKNNPISH